MELPHQWIVAIVFSGALFFLYAWIIRKLQLISPQLFFVAMVSLLIKFSNTLFFQKFVYGGFYASGDTHMYGREGLESLQQISSEPWTSFFYFLINMPTGTEHMISLTGLLYYFMGGASFEGVGIVGAFVSSVGAYLFLRAFMIAFPAADFRWFGFALFLFPSILFWTSLHLKEPWLFFYLGIMTYGVSVLFSKKVFKGAAILAFGGYLAFHIKPHIVLFYFAALPFSILHLRLATNVVVNVISKALIMAVVIFIAAMTFSILEEHYTPGDRDLAEQLIHIQEASSSGGSSVDIKPIESFSDLIYLPYNIVTVLFRPFIFEAHNALSLVVAVENLFLLLWFLLSLLTFIPRFRSASFFFFMITYPALFLIGFSFVIGNLGTMARQKIHILPFLLMFFAYHLGKEKKRSKIVCLPHGVSGAEDGEALNGTPKI